MFHLMNDILTITSHCSVAQPLYGTLKVTRIGWIHLTGRNTLCGCWDPHHFHTNLQRIRLMKGAKSCIRAFCINHSVDWFALLLPAIQQRSGGLVENLYRAFCQHLPFIGYVNGLRWINDPLERVALIRRGHFVNSIWVGLKVSIIRMLFAPFSKVFFYGCPFNTSHWHSSRSGPPTTTLQASRSLLIL